MKIYRNPEQRVTDMVRITFSKVYYGHPDVGVDQELDEDFESFIAGQGVERVTVYGTLPMEEDKILWVSHNRVYHRYSRLDNEEFKSRKEMVANMEDLGLTRDAELIEEVVQEMVLNDDGKWETVGGEIQDDDEWEYIGKWGKWEYDEGDDDEECEDDEGDDDEGDDDEGDDDDDEDGDDDEDSESDGDSDDE